MTKDCPLAEFNVKVEACTVKITEMCCIAGLRNQSNTNCSTIRGREAYSAITKRILYDY